MFSFHLLIVFTSLQPRITISSLIILSSISPNDVYFENINFYFLYCFLLMWIARERSLKSRVTSKNTEMLCCWTLKTTFIYLCSASSCTWNIFNEISNLLEICRFWKSIFIFKKRNAEHEKSMMGAWDERKSCCCWNTSHPPEDKSEIWNVKSHCWRRNLLLW